MSQRYFHLTIGPVQSFVAQARRTRDFWAGSFLLSWMAGVAMATVKHQGGQIEFPIPDENFLGALQGNSTHEPPQQGSVPNRFKALGAKVDQDFSPQLVVSQLKAAWIALAELVWERDLAPALEKDQRQLAISREIWTRQVHAFWEISWCISNDAGASQLLDRRKNWRTHSLPEEPGVKCMMMEGWQELSGQSGPHAEGLGEFWNKLRNTLNKGASTDLRQGEALSALGFIKRRFVRHFHAFKLNLPSPQGELHLRGWQLPAQVPSVAYLAAAPWFKELLGKAKQDANVKQALEQFLEQAEDLGKLPELKANLPDLVKACRAAGFQEDILGIDGSVFFESQLENPRRFENQTQASAVGKSLRNLRNCAQLPEPSPFYAILLMDGDSLGSQMSDPAKQKPISTALNQFTQSVPEIVRQHNGFLVYAGGDDVLALLPLPDALGCALALRRRYTDCFEQVNSGRASNITTSLSAAIEYCHIKRPLTQVLLDAHQLLDDVAKNRTGRDALAVRVWQPGGLHLEWSQPWDYALQEGLSQPNSQSSGLVIEQIARQFAEREAESPFTNKFLFKVMSLAERVPLDLGTDQGALLEQLIRAELMHSGFELGDRKRRSEEAKQLLPPLLRQATQCVRDADTNGTARLVPQNSFQPDALLFVRFLARLGRIE